MISAEDQCSNSELPHVNASYIDLSQTSNYLYLNISDETRKQEFKEFIIHKEGIISEELLYRL